MPSFFLERCAITDSLICQCVVVGTHLWAWMQRDNVELNSCQRKLEATDVNE